MLAEGMDFLTSATAASPLEGVRAARKMREGLWVASWRMLSSPRPVLPICGAFSEDSRCQMAWKLTAGDENNLPSQTWYVACGREGPSPKQAEHLEMR